MLSRTLLTLIAPVILLASCSRSPETDRTESDKTVVVVAVVGDGVPQGVRASGSRRVLFPLNRAQGVAMWKGAEEALRKSPDLAALRDIVQLAPYDDLGQPQDASRIAKRIQDDDLVVAVIGHATSATTRAAAHIYEEAGIPLLMPIATSRYAMYPPGREHDRRARLANCFRLPPSDHLGQAPAVATVARKIVRSKKCLIIGDKSKGAEDYSQPLFDDVVRLLEPIKSDDLMIDRETQDFVALMKNNVLFDPPDLIVFCGYGSTAVKLLNALRQAYESTPLSNRPKIILTDGCLVPDINVAGFHAYLTFPVPSADEIPDSGADARLLRALLVREGANHSYHIYGYDAMLLLGRAINASMQRGALTRDTVLESLREMGQVAGAFLSYTFNEGENMTPRYYVYDSPLTEEKPDNDFRFMRAIESDELAQFSSPLEE